VHEFYEPCAAHVNPSAFEPAKRRTQRTRRG
jgi:hypothetical protein